MLTPLSLKIKTKFIKKKKRKGEQENNNRNSNNNNDRLFMAARLMRSLGVYD